MACPTLLIKVKFLKNCKMFLHLILHNKKVWALSDFYNTDRVFETPIP